MFQINNSDAIEARGGYLCGNDNFHLVRCTNCECQYLCEDELTRIFRDPSDLAVVDFDFVGELSKPCRECGEEDFDWEELGAHEKQKVREGPWSWLLK